MTALIRTSPNRALTLTEELERMAEELWEGWRPVVTLRDDFMSGMEMYEEKDELVIKTELPGSPEGRPEHQHHRRCTQP